MNIYKDNVYLSVPEGSMKMRAVAVFTGMLTGVLSVTGLLSAGHMPPGRREYVCIRDGDKRQSILAASGGHAGGLQPGLVGGDADGD